MQLATIPLCPSPGDVWFFIELRLITEAELPSLYGLIKELGFEPIFATRQVGNETDFCLLLYHENRSETAAPPLNYLFAREQQILANVLKHCEAMRFMCGLHRKREAVAV